MNRFTVEETNLMSIYSEGGKREVMENINAAMPYMDGDMRELAKREINDVHVEAGARLNGALAMEGLIDEYLIYVAPVFLGDGRRLLELPSFKDLCEGVALEFTDIQKVGPDVRLMLRPVR